MNNGMKIMSTGQQRAQSISIQVSDRTRCNARCKPCISRTTPGNSFCEQVNTCADMPLITGLRYAERLGATHAILTGKADPLQENFGYLCKILEKARKYMPIVDMHTNGLVLQTRAGYDKWLDLYRSGLNMITFSIASFDSEQNEDIMGIKQEPEHLITDASNLGLLVRCSLLINKCGINDIPGIMEYIKCAGNFGAHMVVIREVWVPEVYGDYAESVLEWSKENKILIGPLEDEFVHIAANTKNPHGLQQRDPLPWGAPVFAVGGIFDDRNHGVNVTFARCDEANSGPVMKSIVHKPNGHGYRNWDHNGDILY